MYRKKAMYLKISVRYREAHITSIAKDMLFMQGRDHLGVIYSIGGEKGRERKGKDFLNCA